MVGNKHINTQKPESKKAKRNLLKSFLISVNLTSLPTFLTLKKRKELSLIVHIDTKRDTIRETLSIELK
jgi:hypothetical protein